VSPHLGLWARVAGYTTADLDAAVCEGRTLWRMHAMRRTLFVVPARDAAVFAGAAGRAIARKERRRVEQWLGAEMAPSALPAWLADVEQRTLDALAAAGTCTTAELAAAVPELATRVTLGSGRWATRAPLSSRLLFVLAMEGRIVRTRPAGTWRSSQYRWAVADAWFAELPEPIAEDAARVELARRYLAGYGPVTTTDVRWWTGWAARQTAAALQAAGAEPVVLDGGGEAWVLAGEEFGEEPDEASVALLPGLDPTPMGWKERDWYLDGHGARLFDTNGNVGPTVWAGGRIVGGWSQRPDGEVVVGLLERVPAETASRVAAEAAALTAWLDGTVLSTRFPVPLERELAAT
jgi:hypothetical protein